MQKGRRPKFKRSSRDNGRACGYPMVGFCDKGLVDHVLDCHTILAKIANAYPADTFKGRQPLVAILTHLAELSMRASGGMIMLLSHGMWLNVLMQQRLVFEYAVRAQFCIRNEDYARWAFYVDSPTSFARIRGAAMTSADRRHIDFELKDAKRSHPELFPDARRAAGLRPFGDISVSDMVREIGGADLLSAYAEMSTLMHGSYAALAFYDNIDERWANLSLFNATITLLRMSDAIAAAYALPGGPILQELFRVHERHNHISKRYFEQRTEADLAYSDA